MKLPFVAALAVAAVLHAAGAELSAPRQADAGDAIIQARAMVQKDIARKVPGLSIAAAVNGRMVWSESFGYADLESKTPATPRTRFRIGSASKPLSAAGLMLLVEAGKLELDAPIQNYIPDFGQKDRAITLRRLAGHLSGIRNYRGKEIFRNQEFPNLRVGLKIFESDPLEAEPGTRFIYSSYNWNVVGVAMERAANQDFLSYMEDHVFRPLKMNATRPDLANAADPMRAHFYEIAIAGGFVAAPEVNSSYKWPSGGFLSTAEDLVRFGDAQLKAGFLKQQSLQVLFTSQETKAGKPTHYGIGWFIGKTIVYHGGDSMGGASVILLLPAAHVVVAIATNRGHLAFDESSGRFTSDRLVDNFASPLLVKSADKIAGIFASPR